MDTSPDRRDRLINLVKNVRESYDRGSPVEPWLSSLNELSTYPTPGSMCRYTDLPDDVVADICIGWAESQKKLDRNELVDLVRRIQKSVGKASEAEVLLLVYTFQFNCVHPANSDLLFFPDSVFGERTDPTPEMIADMAIRQEGHDAATTEQIHYMTTLP